jgi:hypothetical protein
MADGDLDSSKLIVRSSSVQQEQQFRGASYRDRATAIVKNQKTDLWFMCYNSVKQIIGIPSGESPINRGIKSGVY